MPTVETLKAQVLAGDWSAATLRLLADLTEASERQKAELSLTQVFGPGAVDKFTGDTFNHMLGYVRLLEVLPLQSVSTQWNGEIAAASARICADPASSIVAVATSVPGRSLTRLVARQDAFDAAFPHARWTPDAFKSKRRVALVGSGQWYWRSNARDVFVSCPPTALVCTKGLSSKGTPELRGDCVLRGVVLSGSLKVASGARVVLLKCVIKYSDGISVAARGSLIMSECTMFMSEHAPRQCKVLKIGKDAKLEVDGCRFDCGLHTCVYAQQAESIKVARTTISDAREAFSILEKIRNLELSDLVVEKSNIALWIVRCGPSTHRIDGLDVRGCCKGFFMNGSGDPLDLEITRFNYSRMTKAEASRDFVLQLDMKEVQKEFHAIHGANVPIRVRTNASRGAADRSIIVGQGRARPIGGRRARGHDVRTRQLHPHPRLRRRYDRRMRLLGRVRAPAASAGGASWGSRCGACGAGGRRAGRPCRRA